MLQDGSFEGSNQAGKETGLNSQPSPPLPPHFQKGTKKHWHSPHLTDAGRAAGSLSRHLKIEGEFFHSSWQILAVRFVIACEFAL